MRALQDIAKLSSMCHQIIFSYAQSVRLDLGTNEKLSKPYSADNSVDKLLPKSKNFAIPQIWAKMNSFTNVAINLRTIDESISTF